MKTDPPYNVFERIAGDLLRFHMSRTTDFQQRDGSGNAPETAQPTALQRPQPSGQKGSINE